MTNLLLSLADRYENHRRGKTKPPAVNRHQTPLLEPRHGLKQRVWEGLSDGRHGVRVALRQNGVKQNYSFLWLKTEKKCRQTAFLGAETALVAMLPNTTNLIEVIRVREWLL